MPLHFVTGSPGAGKSAAAKELEARGFLSYDTNDQRRTGLFGWFTRYSDLYLFGFNELTITEQTADDHIWKPSAFALGKLCIEAQTDLVYVCGHLENPQPIIDLSQISGGELVFLGVDDDTVRSRLEARASDPDAPVWGKMDWQRDASVAANRNTEAQFMALGAIMLDGEQPLDNVVDDIVRVTR